ncbi:MULTISPECIES: MBL fold metallo-hydrolase [Sporosarcina]|uniref:MBL fold metallo-hydrolase n=1 Tax=Sporosarcina contaminans TaxID=633403 RepID=A0ABW3TW37_9BACL
MKIDIYPLGLIQTNCYVLSNENGDALIIDPGDEGARLRKEIDKKRLKPVAILLTHAHFDHIGAVDYIRDHYSIPVYMHKEEADWLSNPNLNGSGKYADLPNVSNRAADHFIEEGTVSIGPFTFDVKHTPGHSPGSLSFVFDNDRLAIVGDTLFKESIGRTDLIGGDTQTLLNSIHSKLLSLDDDYAIYPGHGPFTFIEDEKDHNPFLNGF